MQRRHLSAVIAAVAGLAFAGILAGSARAATTNTSSGRTAARRRGAGNGGSGAGSSSGAGGGAGAGSSAGAGGGSGAGSGVGAGNGSEARSADRRKTDGSFWAGGTVTAVDPAAGTVTIARLRNGGNGGNGGTETVRVAADAAITLDKTSETLAGLTIGARALITGRVERNARTATRIDAATSWPLRLGGAVVSVGDGTLTLDELDKTTITVTLTDWARVVLDGRASSLAALPAGARVWVDGTATATSRTVSKVTARTASTRPASDRSPQTAGSGRKAASWK